jgi:hypothetical protein
LLLFVIFCYDIFCYDIFCYFDILLLRAKQVQDASGSRLVEGSIISPQNTNNTERAERHNILREQDTGGVAAARNATL